MSLPKKVRKKMEKTFAEQLKEARKATGLTQKTMAERMLIPRRTLEDWERGINEPAEYVKRLVLNELERAKDDTQDTEEPEEEEYMGPLLPAHLLLSEDELEKYHEEQSKKMLDSMKAMLARTKKIREERKSK